MEYDIANFGPHGWICPKCGRCFAPSVGECPYCGTIDLVTTNETIGTLPPHEVCDRIKPGFAPSKTKLIINDMVDPVRRNEDDGK